MPAVVRPILKQAEAAVAGHNPNSIGKALSKEARRSCRLKLRLRLIPAWTSVGATSSKVQACAK